jgi:hypothetical protein
MCFFEEMIEPLLFLKVIEFGELLEEYGCLCFIVGEDGRETELLFIFGR